MIIEFIPTNYKDRQLALNDFSRKLKSAVREDNPRSFSHEQLVVMLLELAKNTFDHSDGIGILHIQLQAKGFPLQIRYTDTGRSFDVDACSVLGVSEKRGNGVNHGIGLALIRQGAMTAGFSLSVGRVKETTQFTFKRSDP